MVRGRLGATAVYMPASPDAEDTKSVEAVRRSAACAPVARVAAAGRQAFDAEWSSDKPDAAEPPDAAPAARVA